MSSVTFGISNSALTKSSDIDIQDINNEISSSSSKKEKNNDINDGCTSINSDQDHESTANDSRCCIDGVLYNDSEFDEGLGLPDSLTIVSIGGDKPILVERKLSNEDDECDIDIDIEEDDIIINDNELIENYIPFTSIYNTPVKFKSYKRNVFIKDLEVNVRIIDNERSITTHILNPNLYTIELKHGPFVWTIKKRYKHFQALHQQLQIFRASLNILLPTKNHKEKLETFCKSSNEEIFSEPSNNIKLKNVENHKIDEEKKSDVENQQVQDNSMKSTLNSSQNKNFKNLYSMKIRKNKTKRKKSKLPRFPQRPETLITVEALPNRIKQLEDYLYNLLNISLYRNHYDTMNFLEVSSLSFVSGIGQKGKEGPVRKRTGSTHSGHAGCNCCGCFHRNCCVRCNYFCSDVLCGKWRDRWFFVKETFFGYIRPSDGEIRAVILFDQGFDVSTGMYSIGLRKGLQLITNNRQIILKCWTRRKSKEWMQYLKMIANTYARDFIIPNAHNSFAPTRTSIQACWFVDGSSYMNAVADALENALEEIYIADWWLSPEIYMKRPAIDGDYWRLDKILERKAVQGVKIFILLYKEVEMALGINSYYSKQRLVNIHSNIKVMRHPDHAKAGVFFWAHHEKIVVVDQTYAFLGGIDLCYGRWDDFKHRLTDLGSITTSSSSGNIQRKTNEFFSNMDITDNVSHKPFINENFNYQNENVNSLPILSPGDKLLITTKSPGSPSNTTNNVELSYKFEHVKQNTPEMERKHYLDKIKDNVRDNVRKGRYVMKRLTSLDNSIDDKTQQEQQESEQKDSEISNKKLVFSEKELEDRKSDIDDPIPFQTDILTNLDGQAKFWFGKDYTNFIIKDFVNLNAPFVDLVDRTSTPRMPWHDVCVAVLGSSARDLARHFIQRWNATKLEKNKQNQSFPYLMPKSYTNIKLSEKNLKLKLCRVTCQVLRSVSSWSCGFIEQDLVEQSIHNAYIETITKAQHYIYIENQFFISLQIGVNGIGPVKNQIAETLFKRIVRAHKERKKFRVYIIMPLLPAFEGDVGGASGNALRAITNWNYASISRGKSSIIQRLKDVGIKNTGEYISFHSLRNNSLLNNYPITELIYVHSKLLIADDRVVICGSANINDRSMIGKRDSEIGVLITDEEFNDGKMNGVSFPSGVFAGKLRKYLFKEHLGLLESDPDKIKIDVIDPVIDTFWNGVWKSISSRNTEIYDNVFKCIPTENVTSFANLRKYQEEPGLCKKDPELALKYIKDIQGHLVDMPLNFLNSEVLTPPSVSKEGIIPTSVWT